MLDGLRAAGCRCLLVDDGSEPGCAAALAELAGRTPDWLSAGQTRPRTAARARR
jgi:hypothetical protein